MEARLVLGTSLRGPLRLVFDQTGAVGTLGLDKDIGAFASPANSGTSGTLLTKRWRTSRGRLRS
jgi:hypothetical protein